VTPCLAPLALLLVTGSAPAVRGAPRFEAPLPWVQPLRPDLTLPPAPGTSGGIDYLLVEDQVRTGPGPLERYHHFAHRVVSPKGVENGSEVRVDLDPAYQQVVFHQVTIHRGSRHLDALRPEDVRLVQREQELDRRLFDGRLTAVLFLRDVRQGDVVEAAWTVRGGNPVFGSRWAGRFELGYGVPVARLAVRVLSPAGSALAHRVVGLELEPTTSRQGGLVDLRWSRRGVAAIDGEDDLPPGEDPFPYLELSQWASWAEVQAWARPLYAQRSPPAEVKGRLGRWRALPDDAARAQAALRFVQDEIRYLGFELGVNSHRPHPPVHVVTRGFGDCKDKSLLLVSLLGAMGIAAAPALVNTDEAEAIERQLPSPLAFDHVIVRAAVNGRVFWLDPTRSLERSPLSGIEPPPYRRALVVEAGEQGLATIPDPGPALLEVESTYRVAAFQAPVQLEVVSTFSGGRALGMRHRLAESTAAELQKEYLEYYSRRDPGIKLVGPLEVVDREDADRLVLKERYELPAFAEGDERAFEADSIQGALALPKATLRTLPLLVPHPVRVQERIRVELPGPPRLEADEQAVTSDAAKLSRRARPEGNGYVVEFDYLTRNRVVPAAAVSKHVEAVKAMRRLTDFDLTLAVRRRGGPGTDGDGDRGWLWLAALVAVLLTGALVVMGAIAATNGDLARWRHQLRTRGRQRAFRAKFQLEAGEAPATPIELERPAELEAAATRLRCRCGAALLAPPDAPERIRFDGRELFAHALACSRCGARRQVYFAVKG
jgi:Domain of Unknown Function with PDB structure (DUF3857)